MPFIIISSTLAVALAMLRPTGGSHTCSYTLRWHMLQMSHMQGSALTSVGVVQEDELVPVVVVEQRQQGSPNRRSQLQRELALPLGGEAGRDEGDVQSAAEGRQRVDRAFVVQAEDGEHAAGVLGANWGKEMRKETEE